MTETVPETDEGRISAIAWQLAVEAELHASLGSTTRRMAKDFEETLSGMVPATALEAAQARVRELEEHLESDLTAAYLAGQKAARREALEEVEKAFIAECVPGERRPLSSILDTIRALMEKPNANG